MANYEINFLLDECDEGGRAVDKCTKIQKIKKNCVKIWFLVIRVTHIGDVLYMRKYSGICLPS